MNKMRKCAVFCAALIAGTAFAAPSVEITNVQQQYPWTNTVDITYQVQGVSAFPSKQANDTYFATFEAKTSSGEAIADVNGNTIFTNALINGSTTETAQWQPAKNLQLTGCTMTPSVFRGEENAYLVINLETNKLGKFDWWYEPMSTQEASNKRYNTELYKTKYMVFRRIPAGRHRIGHNSWNYNSFKNFAHEVYFPADFYIAVFHMTQSQYQRLLKGNPNSTSVINQNTTWIEGRGNAIAPSVPTEGLAYILSSKTSLCIDLPTHAMVETATRAGITTYWMGNTDSDANSNARYIPGNSRSYDVGRYEPNNWGLYGMVGPGKVWCIDNINTSSLVHTLETALANNFMPMTSGSLNNKVYTDCCGDYKFNDPRQSPSSLYVYPPTTSCWGQRLAIYPAEYYPNGGQNN